MVERAFASLEEAFAYYTECALATAEGLDMLKSASKNSRARAWSIANGMVAEYRAAHARLCATGQRRALHSLPRLQRLLADG